MKTAAEPVDSRGALQEALASMNRKVLARIFWDGQAFVSFTTVNKRFVLRSCIASADGSNPAISGHRKPGHFRRPETGVEFYFTAPCVRKSVWTWGCPTDC